MPANMSDSQPNFTRMSQRQNAIMELIVWADRVRADGCRWSGLFLAQVLEPKNMPGDALLQAIIDYGKIIERERSTYTFPSCSLSTFPRGFMPPTILSAWPVSSGFCLSVGSISKCTITTRSTAWRFPNSLVSIRTLRLLEPQYSLHYIQG